MEKKKEYKQEYKDRTQTEEYESQRGLLNFIFNYGCYADIYGIDDKKTSRTRKRLETLKAWHGLPEIEGSVISSHKAGKNDILGFEYDRFEHLSHYFLYTYENKNITAKQLFVFISLIGAGLMEGDTVLDDKTINRIKRDMRKFGYLEKKNKAQDIFEGLADDELASLYYAIEYFCSKSIYSTPGYFLMKKINNYLKWKRGNDSELKKMFVFEHFFMTHLLNDEVVYSLFNSIRNGVSIYVEYDDKKPIEKGGRKEVGFICPVVFINEYYYGRQYVAAVDEEYQFVLYRLDFLSVKENKNGAFIPDIQRARCVVEEKLKYVWCASYNKNGETEELTIDFVFDDGDEFVKQRMFDEKQWGQIIEKDNNHYEFKIQVADPVELKPWIRRFAGNAKVSEKVSDSLPNMNINKEWKELLNKYESV